MYAKYLTRRIGMFLLVIFLAVTVNFMIPRLMPGDPIEQQLATLTATGGGQLGDIEEMAEAYRARFGLDAPLWKQYINYWWDILHLDFGYSLANYPQTVSSAIRAALPWTLGLLGMTTLIAFVIGTTLGGLLAWPNTPRSARRTIPLLMTVSAIPYFLLGIILIYFFAIRLKIFPAGGGYQFGSVLRSDLETALDIGYHAFLPAVSIIVAGIGVWALEMRGMMISILGEDYISLAEMKGLKEKRIFTWYGIRNGLLPMATALALRLGYIVAGAILVEVIFSYPGIGYKLYQAVQTKDYFVIQGIVLVLIFAIALAMLVLDLIYPLIDPRITYQRR
ncbi:MAG: ABC transporter permease [Caldilineales bacterium]|nr:ABC transporter permease [Caldilineales bacterium]